jgi:superfamily II DNA helicase RecQ
MQLRFFTILVLGGEDAADELNRFLAGHCVLAVDRQLVQNGGASVWAVCVSYEPAGESRPPAAKRGKVDYRAVLSEADFTLYARLRKEIAETEGVPLCSLFTNEQMAEMVTRRVDSVTALREIPGVGEARVEKYGARFLEALAQGLSEAPPSAAKPDEAQLG